MAYVLTSLFAMLSFATNDSLLNMTAFSLFELIFFVYYYLFLGVSYGYNSPIR